MLKVLVAFIFFGCLAFGKEPTPGEIKNQIVELAKSYKGQADKDGSKKAALEVLITQLLQKTPQFSTGDKAANAVGAWHQLWGPYTYGKDLPFTPPLDASKIYQVISPRGVYMNVGVYELFKLQVVGILEGKFNVEQDHIAVEFTKNGMLTQELPAGFTLADVPGLIETSRISVLYFPKELKPVGIRGSLREIFSDDQMRITYGSQEGKTGEDLYVLERVNSLAY